MKLCCLSDSSLVNIILYNISKRPDETLFRLDQLSLVSKYFYRICKKVYLQLGGQHYYSKAITYRLLEETGEIRFFTTRIEKHKDSSPFIFRHPVYQITTYNLDGFVDYHMKNGITNQMRADGKKAFETWKRRRLFYTFLRGLVCYKKWQINKVLRSKTIRDYLCAENSTCLHLPTLLIHAITEVILERFNGSHKYAFEAAKELSQCPKKWRSWATIDAVQRYIQYEPNHIVY